MVGIAQPQHVRGNFVHQVPEAILDLVTIGPLALQPAPLTAYRISRFCSNAADASGIFVVDACRF